MNPHDSTGAQTSDAGSATVKTTTPVAVTTGVASPSQPTTTQNPPQDVTSVANGSQTATTDAQSSGANTSPKTDQSAKPHSDESRFDIPEFVRLKYPDLIPLVLETESMNDEERQYWFHILPIMTPEQVKKFHDILVNEKEQLAKLDHTYENELKNLNEKNPNAANIYKTKEKQKEIRKKEALEEVEEKAKEEDILKQLGSL